MNSIVSISLLSHCCFLNYRQQLVKKNGGTIKSSVTKDLSYLVTNDTTSGSSKNVKAAKLGIPVIDEKQFLELI